MHLTTVSAAIAASLSMVQFCPAPPAVLGPILGGALAGEAGGIVGYGVGKIGKKRSFEGSVFEKRADPFAGLPQPAADTCKDQLNGVKVEFTPTGPGAFRIDNAPSACSAALGYTGLSDDDINKLQAALEGKGY
ncbi:hypothetical protein N7444_012755 [Penicillium canescens]|nr:hypothetical protein N7444_012755 [Penicillium canescens]